MITLFVCKWQDIKEDSTNQMFFRQTTPQSNFLSPDFLIRYGIVHTFVPFSLSNPETQDSTSEPFFRELDSKTKKLLDE
jgi:hypothetical protein